MDATGVWALLYLGVLVVLALLGLALLTERTRPGRPDPDRLRLEAEELAAHAAAAQAKAGQAVAVAVEAREKVAAVERSRDEAWAAQETAEQAYDEALREAMAGRRPTDEADDEAGAEQERVVTRAALSAYRRGDISVREMREVWQRIGQLDPLQQEREKTADRCRVLRAAARRVHDQATAAVRRADQAAQVAEVAAQALVDEAAIAAVEAHEALLVAQREGGRRLPRFRRRAS
ncbi:hypothetical protein GCM10027290_62010 [Micromonospora sonneratiae]|uniref:Colicin import membrane protein n=1 Tax=Micromonospora sonneratiae TaxID=1184706 RepID=A0ABW3YCZ0_9ACTN